jgi:hypothetical protein
MLGLQAKSHYLLATAFRLVGTERKRTRHYSDTHRILDEMRKEAKSDTFLKRGDLSAIYSNRERRLKTHKHGLDDRKRAGLEPGSFYIPAAQFTAYQRRRPQTELSG